MPDTTTKEKPSRSYPADEITKDPIFLFQRRRWQLTSEPEDWCIVDDYMVPRDREDNPMHDAPEDMLKSVSWADCKDFEETISWWDTEYVFFTREEAKTWGENHDYNYRDGWRVYCVCSKGELATLMESATTHGDPS